MKITEFYLMNNYIFTYPKSSANEKWETVILWKCEIYIPMENDYAMKFSLLVKKNF